MTAEASTVLRLICKTQSYDWGKVGPESQVAQLASSTAGFTPRDDAPYAEVGCSTSLVGYCLLRSMSNMFSYGWERTPAEPQYQ